MSKGQSTLEYAVVIIAVVAALIAMRGYLTRSMQGRLRQAGDELGQQYEPRKTTGTSTMSTSSTTTTTSTPKSMSETDAKIDFNNNGILESTVFGYVTESKSEISAANPATTTQSSDETVGPL